MSDGSPVRPELIAVFDDLFTEGIGVAFAGGIDLEPLSRGATTAYGVYFNPTGGTFGARARNGRTDVREEIGLDADQDSPEGHWLFRFWQWDDDAPHSAGSLAYACWAAGMRLADATPVAGPPRRWVRLRSGEEGQW